MKAAPPYSPTIYGNLQRFPSPMADPAIATSTPKRLPKFSLCISSPFYTGRPVSRRKPDSA